jgi:hypothetical protein
LKQLGSIVGVRDTKSWGSSEGGDSSRKLFRTLKISHECPQWLQAFLDSFIKLSHALSVPLIVHDFIGLAFQSSTKQIREKTKQK